MKTAEEYANAIGKRLGMYVRDEALVAFDEGKDAGYRLRAAEHSAKIDEKDATITHLKARVATLEGALKVAMPYALRDIHEIWDADAMKAEALIENAISAQPAVSLNAIKAAALRAWAEKRSTILTGDFDNDRTNYPEWWDGVRSAVHEVLTEADRLEAGEGEDAEPTS